MTPAHVHLAFLCSKGDEKASLFSPDSEKPEIVSSRDIDDAEAHGHALVSQGGYGFVEGSRADARFQIGFCLFRCCPFACHSASLALRIFPTYLPTELEPTHRPKAGAIRVWSLQFAKFSGRMS